MQERDEAVLTKYRRIAKKKMWIPKNKYKWNYIWMYDGCWPFSRFYVPESQIPNAVYLKNIFREFWMCCKCNDERSFIHNIPNVIFTRDKEHLPDFPENLLNAISLFRKLENKRKIDQPSDTAGQRMESYSDSLYVFLSQCSRRNESSFFFKYWVRLSLIHKFQTHIDIIYSLWIREQCKSALEDLYNLEVSDAWNITYSN